MKFACEKGLLESMLSVATRAIAAKSTMEILDCALLELEEGTLTVSCYNEMLGIRCTLPVEEMSAGSAAVPGKLLLDIIKKLPGGEMTCTVAPTNLVTLLGSGTRMTLQGRSADQFPALPLDTQSAPIKIAPAALRDLIRRTSFCIAVDESRPVLTGAFLQVEANTARMVAMDSFRLALSEQTLGAAYETCSAIVPGRALSEIGHVIGDDREESAQLYLEDRRLVVGIGETKIMARLQEGEYIKYSQILPSSYATRVVVERSAFADAVDRASLYAREGRNNLMRLSIVEDSLAVTANSEMGDVYEKLPVLKEGKDLEIAFNVRYVSDLLKALESEKIILQFNANVSPCVVEPLDEETKSLFLILPVRLFGA